MRELKPGEIIVPSAFFDACKKTSDEAMLEITRQLIFDFYGGIRYHKHSDSITTITLKRDYSGLDETLIYWEE